MQPTPPPSTEIKKILLFLAEGFEDFEAVTLLSMCGWSEYRSHLETLEVVITGLHESVQGRFGLSLAVNLLIKDVVPSDYEALVVPGGFHDRGFDEAYCQPLRDLAQAMHAQGSLIATMCVGVLPVAESGILDGGKATTYAFSSSHDNFGRLQELGCEVVHEPIVVWNRIISCSGPVYSPDVVMLLLEDIVGAKAAGEILRFRCGIDR